VFNDPLLSQGVGTVNKEIILIRFAQLRLPFLGVPKKESFFRTKKSFYHALKGHEITFFGVLKKEWQIVFY
jgi:hypothetical protein